RRIRMRDDGEPAAAMDVLDDVGRLAGERIRRGVVEAEHDEVPAVGADLDGVDREDARSVRGRERRGGAVAMVREDDERETGLVRRARDRVDGSTAVGS